MTARYNVNDNTDLLGAITGAALASNDTLTFDQYDTEFSGSLNQSAVDLAMLTFTPGFTGNFNIAFKIGCNQTGAKTVVNFGGDILRLAGAVTHRELIIAPEKPSAIIDISDLTATTLRALTGNLFFADSAGGTTFDLGGTCKTTFFYGGSAAAIPTINAKGDTFFELRRDVTDVSLKGNARGVYNHKVVAPSSTTIDGAGRLTVLAMASSGGTLYLDGGVVDFSQLTTPVTFAGGRSNPNCTVILPRGNVDVDISALTKEGRGARIMTA